MGKPVLLEGCWNEGVGAMVQHLLGVVVGYRGGLDAEIAEHGVGFPATEELDGVLVNASAKEGGRSPWAKGAGRDEVEGHASVVFDGLGGVTEGVGDVSRRCSVPRSVVRVRIEIVVDGCFRCGGLGEEAECDTA